MASAPLRVLPFPAASRWRSLTATVGTALVLATSGIGATSAAAEDTPVGPVAAPAEVTIVGTVSVDETVFVEAGTWTPADTVLTYQWSTDYAPMDGTFDPMIGSVSDHVIIGAELIGLPLRVTVTGTAPDGGTETRTSAPVTVAPGVFTSAPVPTVHGFVQVGEELLADITGWSHAATFTAQWFANGIAIPGATFDRYAIAAADVGKRLTFRVTATAGGFPITSRTSVPTAAVAAGVIDTSPIPTLSGTVRVGGAVTAKPDIWMPGTALTYQWRRNGLPIAGATGTVYRPGLGDRTHRLSVSVTGRLAGFTKVTRTSVAATVAPGVFTTAPTPTIAGTVRVGHVLTARPGTWGPAGTLSYRWLRNGALIPGATGAAYRLTAADHGRQLTVRVYAARAGWTGASRTSLPTSVVVAPFAAVHGPTITGTARMGSLLTASVRAWSPAAAFTYQWRRNGAPIAAATGPSYRLTGADYNQVVTVTVYGSRTAYVPAAYTSRGTAKIAGPAASLSKDGMYAIGSQLAAGTYVTGATTFCYWERRSNSGDDLDGIIANEFADGQRIVEIKASDAYFHTEDCGTWTRLTALGAPVSKIRNGVFAVGVHIVPGTYATAGGSGCYWARVSGFSGELADIVENSFGPGPQTVRIDTGDVGFESANCGTWIRTGD